MEIAVNSRFQKKLLMNRRSSLTGRFFLISSINFLINDIKYFSITADRTPKQNPTGVRVAAKKTNDYDNVIVENWTNFAMYVSNRVPDYFTCVFYTLLIAIFAQRA